GPPGRPHRAGGHRLAAQEAAEVLGQRLRRGVAPVRLLLEALQAHRLEVARHLGLQQARRRRLCRNAPLTVFALAPSRLASPKSVSFHDPSPASRALPGLTSRWTTPRACACPRAPPSHSSSARNGEPPHEPTS